MGQRLVAFTFCFSPLNFIEKWMFCRLYSLFVFYNWFYMMFFTDFLVKVLKKWNPLHTSQCYTCVYKWTQWSRLGSVYIRHADQGGLKAERSPGRLRGQSDSWDAPLMLTKLIWQLTPSPPPVSCLCFPGEPFQWCAAVSNSARAKSTPPKSSTPKSSRPEVREGSERKTLNPVCVCVCVFSGARKNMKKQRHHGGFHHYVCVPDLKAHISIF